ncbi:MAG: hypothetical protein O2913_14170 [Chloroflexi bacterium]|nr:hypothetical protein [Chloroflexota bacterium]
MEDLRKQYSSLLRDYHRNDSENHRSRAADLGTAFAAEGFLPADIAKAHQQATLEIERNGAGSSEQAVSCLADVVFSYGLASQESTAGAAQEGSRQSKILEAIQRIAETLSGRASFTDKCEAVLKILVDLMPADLATLRRPDETGEKMILVSYAGKPGFEYEPPVVVSNQRPISFQPTFPIWLKTLFCNSSN